MTAVDATLKLKDMINVAMKQEQEMFGHIKDTASGDFMETAFQKWKQSKPLLLNVKESHALWGVCVHELA